MAATTVPSGQFGDSLLDFVMTVAAEEDAFPRLFPQARQRTGVAMARKGEGLLRRVSMVKVQGRHAPVISAYMAGTARLIDEDSLYDPPAGRHRFVVAADTAITRVATPVKHGR